MDQTEILSAVDEDMILKTIDLSNEESSNCVALFTQYFTTPGQHICVLGSTEELGSWDANNIIYGKYITRGWWRIILPKQKAPRSDDGAGQFKLLFVDEIGRKRWEERENLSLIHI